jgi:hypothetical protein
VPLAAEITSAAGPINPGDANAIADLEVANPFAFLHHATGNLVPEDQWLLRYFSELRPVPIGYVQIRMTHPAGFHLNE